MDPDHKTTETKQSAWLIRKSFEFEPVMNCTACNGSHTSSTESQDHQDSAQLDSCLQGQQRLGESAEMRSPPTCFAFLLSSAASLVSGTSERLFFSLCPSLSLSFSLNQDNGAYQSPV